jgi:hypothetical protein
LDFGREIHELDLPSDFLRVACSRVLVGFGANGVVYLAVRDGTTARLEKARMK